MTTLKLEVGKSYRTRDGRKVTVIDNSDGSTFPYSTDIGETYDFDGNYWSDETVSNFDLISEWQDEPTPVTYTQADVEPLLDALEAVSEALTLYMADHHNSVYGPDELELARQALERFKGMNTLAPDK